MVIVVAMRRVCLFFTGSINYILNLWFLDPFSESIYRRVQPWKGCTDAECTLCLPLKPANRTCEGRGLACSKTVYDGTCLLVGCLTVL